MSLESTFAEPTQEEFVEKIKKLDLEASKKEFLKAMRKYNPKTVELFFLYSKIKEDPGYLQSWKPELERLKGIIALFEKYGKINLNEK